MTDVEFHRDGLIAGLTALRDGSERTRDDAVAFVSQELRVSLYAVVQVHNGIAADDRLGPLHHLRLLAECTLRLCWIAGDVHAAGPEGRPLVDGAMARERVDGVRKRDLLQLASAYTTIHDIRGDDTPLGGEVRAMADAIAAPAAPGTFRDLATSTHARAVYTAHRMCSTLVHAGLGMSRLALMPPERVAAMTDETAYVCLAWSWAILRGLGVDIPLDWDSAATATN